MPTRRLAGPLASEPALRQKALNVTAKRLKKHSVKMPQPHPKTASAQALAITASSGAATMNAVAIAVTAQPAAVMLVMSATPFCTWTTLLPSVICSSSRGDNHGGAMPASCRCRCLPGQS